MTVPVPSSPRPSSTPGDQSAHTRVGSNIRDGFQMEPRQSAVFPLLMSMGAHVVILVILGVLVRQIPGGTGRPEDRPIGIAMAHSLPDRTQYVDVAEQNLKQAPEVAPPQSPTSSAAQAPPESLVPPLDLEGVFKSIAASPVPTSASGIAGTTDFGAEDFGVSSSPAQVPSTEQATAVLFGISGTGSRFVYVFDRSDSMNGYRGKPLRAAKGELLRSLTSLTDRQQFQIIFYNDKPAAMQVSGRGINMIDGDEAGMVIARRHVGSIAAFGGTEHSLALNMALRMGPDVIFFLTDARIPRLSSSELKLIQRRAQRGGATIHTIEFGSEPDSPPDSFLRELAAMNRGEYRYVNVQELGSTKVTTP